MVFKDYTHDINMIFIDFTHDIKHGINKLDMI